MKDSELEWLVEESKKGFKCENTECPDYLKRPICSNHAHVNCEDYDNEKTIRLFLKNYRQTDGDYRQ